MVHTCIAVVLLSLIGAIFSGPSCASDKPQPGNRYKIVGPLYLTGVYKDLNDRRQPSFADLSPVQSSGPEVAFLQKVAGYR